MAIIPNFHPVLVHFTIALTATALGTALLAWVFKPIAWLHQEGLVVSRWCLWLAAIAAIATVGAGFHAFYTVDHDAISHIVMKVHRNWALVSLAALIVLALISLKRFIKKQAASKKIVLGLLAAFILVMSTGWYGAELVYRYGIGVMSLPQVHGEGHDHAGTGSEASSSMPGMDEPMLEVPVEAPHNSSPHGH